MANNLRIVLNAFETPSNKRDCVAAERSGLRTTFSTVRLTPSSSCYPDASHGAQSQHAGVFLEHARMFLNG